MGVLSNLRANLKISPENYGLENDYATRIQKHVKGFLTRNAFKRDIMHIKNEIKNRKSSITDLKKSKSKSSAFGSRHSFDLDEHALKNVLSDDLFEDAILLSNFNKINSHKTDDEFEVKLTNKNFSVISRDAPKDSKDSSSKVNKLNDSDIKSEIEYNKSAEFAVSKKLHESDHIRTEYDKSESRKFYETGHETIKTDIESKHNESKKFGASIKTELSQTTKSVNANRFNSYMNNYEDKPNDDLDESDKYTADFEATGSASRYDELVVPKGESVLSLIHI